MNEVLLAALPLVGVVLGVLLMPFTQLYLESRREQRAADRAKQLVAAELLHTTLTLRTASAANHWPHVDDVNTFLPTSAWQENRSSLVGKVPEDLWNDLVMAYAILETDRARFALASRSPAPIELSAKEARGHKLFSYELGHLRRQLGGGGGWLDEIVGDEGAWSAEIGEEIKRRLK